MRHDRNVTCTPARTEIISSTTLHTAAAAVQLYTSSAAAARRTTVHTAAATIQHNQSSPITIRAVITTRDLNHL